MRLHDAISHLTSALLGWEGFLKDPNFIRAGAYVCWPNRTEMFLPSILTRSDTRRLGKERQFSFRISEDNSLIQVAYEFNHEGIVSKARLGYFEVGDAAEYEDGVFPVPDASGDDPIRWLRIDFDSLAPVQVVHTACHMHISGHPNLRFALKGVPSPAQFVELVFASFYPNTYSLFRLNHQGHFANIATVDNMNSSLVGAGDAPSELLLRIPHFLIPGY